MLSRNESDGWVPPILEQEVMTDSSTTIQSPPNGARVDVAISRNDWAFFAATSGELRESPLASGPDAR